MIRALSRWILAALFLASFQGVAADPESTWVFDSIAPNPTPSASSATPTEEEQVYAAVLDQVRLWNAHDVEHYMDLFWKSRDLLLVIDGEQIMGWADILAAYQRGYPDRSEMATVTLQRAKIQKLSPDFYLALTWFTFRRRGKDAFSTDTMIFRKFPDGWKVISGHSSFLEP
jgi:ketosteroid isomerase-like protein